MVMAKLMTVVTIYVVAVSAIIISGIGIFDPLLLVFGTLLLFTQLFMLVLGCLTQTWGRQGFIGQIRLRDIAFWILMFLATLLVYGFLLAV
jgi:hypothetical protein